MHFFVVCVRELIDYYALFFSISQLRADALFPTNQAPHTSLMAAHRSALRSPTHEAIMICGIHQEPSLGLPPRSIHEVGNVQNLDSIVQPEHEKVPILGPELAQIKCNRRHSIGLRHYLLIGKAHDTLIREVHNCLQIAFGENGWTAVSIGSIIDCHTDFSYREHKEAQK